MKRWIIGSLVVAAVAATGCTNKKKQEPAASGKYPPMNQASLDVPATPPPAPAVQYTPPPQPVVYDAPAAAEQPVIEEAVVDASDSVAPVRSTARRASAAGTKYKVKKGESLWSIAQAKYGNGNKWKAIAAANPRLDPDKIQAGQTIVLP